MTASDVPAGRAKNIRVGLYGAVGFALGACAATAGQSLAQRAVEPGPTELVSAATASAGATVIGLNVAERRQIGGGKASIRLLARGKNAFVGRLEVAAGGRVPEHRDATEEFIHVQQGGGVMWIDDVRHEVAEGATVYMPANAKVRFENGPQQLVAIQVFAGPSPATKYDKWTLVTP